MYKNYIKRLLDIICSLVAIIVLCWLFAILAILVRTRLGSPVLFKQDRPGKDEEIFQIYKFRTMTEETDEKGELLPDEERLTKLGKRLRHSSLDELPELFNILKGDMSVIGPRPLAVRYLPFYSVEEKHRHDVRPGLSGLAQVSGRNALPWEERFACDVYYVNHISFKMDCSILIKTVRKVFRREDVVVRGTETSILDFDIDRKQKLATQEKATGKGICK